MGDQKNGESMPPIYKHEVKCEVTVGKKVFILNESQMQVLKEMSLAGKSSMVWFDGFAISIPHISSVEISEDKYLKGEYKHMPWMEAGHSEYVFNPISKEEYEDSYTKQVMDRFNKLALS